MGNQTVDEPHRVGKKHHGSQWGPNSLNMFCSAGQRKKLIQV